MSRPHQFDLFPTTPEPPRDDRPPQAPESAEEDERMPLPPEDMADAPPLEARPTSPSRADREARRARIRHIMDDTLARLGTPGKQMLSDTESPFARGTREVERTRREAEARRKKQGSGGK